MSPWKTSSWEAPTSEAPSTSNNDFNFGHQGTTSSKAEDNSNLWTKTTSEAEKDWQTTTWQPETTSKLTNLWEDSLPSSSSEFRDAVTSSKWAPDTVVTSDKHAGTTTIAPSVAVPTESHADATSSLWGVEASTVTSSSDHEISNTIHSEAASPTIVSSPESVEASRAPTSSTFATSVLNLNTENENSAASAASTSFTNEATSNIHNSTPETSELKVSASVTAEATSFAHSTNDAAIESSASAISSPSSFNPDASEKKTFAAVASSDVSSAATTAAPSSVVLYSESAGSFVPTTIPYSSLEEVVKSQSSVAAAEASSKSKESNAIGSVAASASVTTTSNWVPSLIETAAPLSVVSASKAGIPVISSSSATTETLTDSADGFASASSTSSSSSSASASASHAAQLPNAITPATQPSTVSNNYTLITVGFKSGLNYPFVVSHSLASAQIFQYLPLTLTYPFQSDNNVAVKQLVPFQSSSLDYIVTVAEVYFPKKWVESLNESLQTSYSSFYFNTNPTENSIAQLVDINIPLVGLDTGSLGLSGSSGSSSGSSSSGSRGGNGGSSDTEGTQGLTSSSSGSFDAVQDSSASHANSKLGVVGTTSGMSAAVYITVLLVGYRVYKKKKGLVFATKKDGGGIVLPVAERGVVNTPGLLEDTGNSKVLVNPVYVDPTLQRRNSYQSLRSVKTYIDAPRNAAAEIFGYSDSNNDTESVLMAIEEGYYDEEMSLADEVESIIPQVSAPTAQSWF